MEARHDRARAMMPTVRKALFVVVLPIAAFLLAGYPMMHFTERSDFPRTAAAESVPLNFRPAGYDAMGAIVYWQWLGAEGRRAEERFLIADFVFPVVYGGSLMASLLIAWAALGRPFRRAWLITPVAVAVIADWVENAIHLRQLQAFMAGGDVQGGAIQFASVATSLKSVAFYLAASIVLVLAAWMVVRARRPPPS